MIIEDIRIVGPNNGAPQNPPYHYDKTLEIITDVGKVTTPHKTTNRAEFRARSGIPLLKVLPNEITSDFRLLDEKQIKAIMGGTKDSSKFVNTVSQFNDITRKSLLRFSTFQPAENVLKIWGHKEKIEFANLQAQYLQYGLDSDLITYPYLDLPVSDYINFIDSKYGRGYENQSNIFTLDLGMDPTHLKKIIDHLIAKEQPTIISIIHKPWRRTISQHAIINSYFGNKKAEKIAFLASQVERIEYESNTSNTHAVAVGSNFDIVALKQARGFPQEQKLELNRIMFYAPESLQLNNLDTTFADPNRSLIGEFNIPTDDYLDLIHLNNIIQGVNGASVHPKKYQIVFYLSRVHEAYLSPDNFTRLREHIMDQDVIQHIQNTNLRNVPMIRNYSF